MEAKTKFKSWLTLALFSRSLESLKLETLTRPLKVGKVVTPETLNDMTMGQMVTLSSCDDGRKMFYVVCETLLGMKAKEVDRCKAVEVVRFVGWVVGRVQRINALFDGVKSKPEPEEVRAGIHKLNFGIFGLIDWYAKRMGISDHEEVMHVTWGRVYKCLEMDNKTAEYQKRLQKIYIDEHRR